MAEDTGSLTTIQRGLKIIDILLDTEGAGPTEVADRMDLPVTTVYEYLRSMSETKFVNCQDGTYSLSSYFITICGKMRYRNGLFQVAKREIRRVAEETGEHVGLTIEDNGWAVMYHQEVGDRGLDLGIYPGVVTPMHTNATGKVLLAYLPEERRAEIIDEGSLESRTEHTITDPDRLRSELADIRSKGYAIDWDELVVGMGMISVPIVVDDQLLASLTISTPTQRLQREDYREELLQMLREMQSTITINYQYSQ